MDFGNFLCLLSFGQLGQKTRLGFTFYSHFWYCTYLSPVDVGNLKNEEKILCLEN